MVQLYHQTVFHSVIISDLLKCAAFPLLCSLSVSRMKQRHIPIAVELPGNGGANTRIHSATQENNRFTSVGHIFSGVAGTRRPWLREATQSCAAATPTAPSDRPPASIQRA